MRDKLEKIIKAYEELEKKLSDPAVASDIKEFTRSTRSTRTSPTSSPPRASTSRAR